MLPVFLYELLNTVDFISTIPSAGLQSDRVEPEFCWVLVTLNMEMRRFVAIRATGLGRLRRDSAHKCTPSCCARVLMHPLARQILPALGPSGQSGWTYSRDAMLDHPRTAESL
jgi:hypothetical protein